MNFDFHNPYPSVRLPVFARNAVSTSHPLAAQAGLRMLWKGGNAVDAAIACAAAMTIVEPVSNGLGSDAFCILWDGKELHGLNSSGPAPASWTLDYFRRKYGADAKTPAQARIRLGHGAGRGRFLGGTERALRQAAVRRPAGAGDRDCRARLPAAGRGAAEVGRRDAGTGQPAGIRRIVPTLGPGAQGRRVVPVQGGGARAAGDRGNQGRRVLWRRDRAGDREVRRGQRRQHHRARLRRFQAGVGQADRQGIPRLHAARDPAQRARDRRVDGAGHPEELRRRRPAGRRRRLPAPADRGDEARVRRRLPLRVGAAHHGGDAAADARRRLPGQPRQADRHEAGAGLRRRQPGQGRHDLPHGGRRERDDGVVHPEQLHGLRLRLRGAEHSASACRTAATASACSRDRTRSRPASGRSTRSSRPS